MTVLIQVICGGMLGAGVILLLAALPIGLIFDIGEGLLILIGGCALSLVALATLGVAYLIGLV